MRIVRAVVPVLALVALPGCGWNPLSLFGGGVPAGTVTGLVLYAGEPAPGKTVTYGSQSGVTDATGRYTFTGVTAAGQVTYLAAVDAVASATSTNANEVYSWSSQPVDPGAGKEIPPFDVSYNGLLYPDRGVALVVSTTSPVPFHFSVHPMGQQYRLHLLNAINKKEIYVGNWDSQPYAVFAQNVAPGNYLWEVEIDGGDAGAGFSRTRGVDMGG